MALQDLTPQLRTRLSRMERAVGWFVLLATALLLFGFTYYAYHTAERKGWFKTRAPYFTFTQRATGLKVGDPVLLMGFEVGQITRIDAQPPDDWYFNVYVEFEIKEPYYDYMWTVGSRAKITTADFLGKRVLEVTKGTNGYPAYVFNPFRELTLNEANTSVNGARRQGFDFLGYRLGPRHLLWPQLSRPYVLIQSENIVGSFLALRWPVLRECRLRCFRRFQDDSAAAQ